MPPDDRFDVSRVMATALQILTEVYEPPLPSVPDADALGTESPSMRHVMALAARIARTDATVLITGESGVGKERLARWLHRASSRAPRPFLAVNCGAFPDTLLDSELFGHVRGAFTGAHQDRRGLFEDAHGGTLLLDEIGDVSASMQVKLLRVLQEREIRRVGDTKTRPIDVRLMAATHRDLEHEVAQQRFREDLYYRLNVIDLQIPPLRERLEDLQTLAHVFLAQTAARLRRPFLTYAPAALDRILHYTWPGNIRQLAHAIERACTVAAGPLIVVDDLPFGVQHAPVSYPSIAVARPLRVREREHAEAVLARHGGHRREAAKALGISVSTLYRILRRRS
jgi:two-component system response regulator HydG